MAFFAAPAIGGAIGVWGGLSGAAATSHGLALLGGGSLAAGGFGMAGGTVVVTAAGAGIGSAMGANVATSYFRYLPAQERGENVGAWVTQPVVFVP